MSVNLLDLVQGQLGGPIVRQLGQRVGADEASVRSALDGAVPTLLAGLVKQGSELAGAKDLYRSFRTRRVKAQYRTSMEVPGPRRTAESYVLEALLEAEARDSGPSGEGVRRP